MWWDKTIDRWHAEGLPAELTGVFEIHEYFGLDPYKQYWFSTTDATIEAEQHHVEGMVSDMDDYLAHRPNLFPDHGDAILGDEAVARTAEQGRSRHLDYASKASSGFRERSWASPN